MPLSMITTSQERSKYHQKTVDLYRKKVTLHQTWSDLVLCALNIIPVKGACRLFKSVSQSQDGLTGHVQSSPFQNFFFFFLFFFVEKNKNKNKQTNKNPG